MAFPQRSARRREVLLSDGPKNQGFCGTIFLNARSNASSLSSVPCSRAAWRKRSYCSGSSAGTWRVRGFGLGDLVFIPRLSSRAGNALQAMSVRILHGDCSAMLRTLDAEMISQTSSSNGNSSCSGSRYGSPSGQSGLGGGGFSVSRSVGQPLADNPAQRPVGAFHVVNTESDAVTVAEIELGEIPMQMILADVEIAAVYAALEEREEAFHSIGVRFAAVR